MKGHGHGFQSYIFLWDILGYERLDYFFYIDVCILHDHVQSVKD